MISDHSLVVLIAAVHVIGLLLAAVGLAAGIAALRSRRGRPGGPRFSSSRSSSPWLVGVFSHAAAAHAATSTRSRSCCRWAPPWPRALPPLAAAGRRLRSASLPGLAFPLRSSGPDAARRRSVRIAALALGAWLAAQRGRVGLRRYLARGPAVAAGRGRLARRPPRARRPGRRLAGGLDHGDERRPGPRRRHHAPRPPPGRLGAAATDQARRLPLGVIRRLVPARAHDATFVIAVTDPARSRGGLPVTAGPRPLRPARRPGPDRPGRDHALRLQPAHPADATIPGPTDSPGPDRPDSNCQAAQARRAFVLENEFRSLEAARCDVDCGR